MAPTGCQAGANEISGFYWVLNQLHGLVGAYGFISRFFNWFLCWRYWLILRADLAQSRLGCYINFERIQNHAHLEKEPGLCLSLATPCVHANSETMQL